MIQNVKLDFKHTGITEKDFMKYAEEVEQAHEELHKKIKDKKEPLGWMEWPTKYDKKELEKLKKAAKKIQSDSEILVVIGIGGSYLGARAVIEALTHTFYNYLPKEQRKTPQIIYVGNNLSPNYINDVIDLIGNRDISINVISKSGTTTEPAIAFRMFRELIENKYGLKEAKKRIYVTTDKKEGALKQVAKQEDYTTFVIPSNIGGRYSVLTPVGLLPIAVSGINIDKLLEGARFAQEKYFDGNLKYNDCYKYAVIRNMLYKDQKGIEILVSYEPKLHYVIEWWKQLFGESEGKKGKGIYPTGADFTTDLHSLGQYIQEGKRFLFETIINIKESSTDIKINQDEDNLDELNYLAGKGLDEVNKKAMEGVIKAHEEGGVPNLIITMDKLNEYNLGHLIYFFELACAMSGTLLGVNPFNQPGVEKYKANMFELLGKPQKNAESTTKTKKKDKEDKLIKENENTKVKNKKANKLKIEKDEENKEENKLEVENRTNEKDELKIENENIVPEGKIEIENQSKEETLRIEDESIAQEGKRKIENQSKKATLKLENEKNQKTKKENKINKEGKRVKKDKTNKESESKKETKKRKTGKGKHAE